jgi:hypothetical protein
LAGWFRRLPIGWDTVKYYTQIGTGPAYKYFTGLKKHSRDEHKLFAAATVVEKKF